MNRDQRANDRLAWMEGVKVIKPSHEGEEHNNEGKMVTLGMRENEGTVSNVVDATKDATVESRETGMESRSSSVPRGTDAGTAREGGQTETAGSVSKATGTIRDRDGGSYVNLGEEMTSIVRRLSRITFEKVRPGAFAFCVDIDATPIGTRRWSIMHCVALLPDFPSGDIHLPERLPLHRSSRYRSRT